MPSKRDLLEALGRNELLAILDARELVVEDRRRREALVDVLARARSVKAEDVLAELPRDRLKELCRQFGLTAAVVGVVGSVAVAFGRTVLFPAGLGAPDWGAIAIAVAGFAIVQWTRLDALWVIGGGLVAGLLLRFA